MLKLPGGGFEECWGWAESGAGGNKFGGTEGGQMDREEKGRTNRGTKGGTKLLGTNAAH